MVEKKKNRKWKWKWHPSRTSALEQTGGEEEQKDSGMEIVPTRKRCMGTNWCQKTVNARLWQGNSSHQELVHGKKTCGEEEQDSGMKIVQKGL